MLRTSSNNTAVLAVPVSIPVPTIISEVIANQMIPALNEAQVRLATEYLYKHAKIDVRIQVAELAYRDPKHCHASDLFLASVIPMAKGYARNKTDRLFFHPTDWHVECFYHGGAMALMKMFERQTPVGPTHEDFRRYLLRTMANGALGAFFLRSENRRVEMVANVEEVRLPRSQSRNPAEQEVITRELLEQIARYPLLKRALSKTLGCIVDMGAGHALKESDPAHSDPAHNDPSRRAPRRYNVPVLDCAAIAQARGLKVGTVWEHLCTARKVLRMAFNGDGRLFQTH